MPRRIAIVLGILLLAHAARAGPLEGEGQVGAVVSNLPELSAFALARESPPILWATSPWDWAAC
jgi:hypothetical protein